MPRCSVDKDPRPLYEIPKVVAFCKKLVRIGFIAGLDVSFMGLAGRTRKPLFPARFVD